MARPPPHPRITVRQPAVLLNMWHAAPNGGRRRITHLTHKRAAIGVHDVVDDDGETYSRQLSIWRPSTSTAPGSAAPAAPHFQGVTSVRRLLVRWKLWMVELMV